MNVSARATDMHIEYGRTTHFETYRTTEPPKKHIEFRLFFQRKTGSQRQYTTSWTLQAMDAARSQLKFGTTSTTEP